MTNLENNWKRWTQSEIQYLIKNYYKEDMDKMVNILGRTEIAINLRAQKLKLKRIRANGIFKRIENDQRKLRMDNIHNQN